jgi:hypothetical protein
MKIPASDEATALSVAQALCDGEMTVLEAPIDITVAPASETAVSSKLFTVTGKNNASGSVTTVKFFGKASVTTTDVENAFLGKTINGVTIDEVFISVSVYNV